MVCGSCRSLGGDEKRRIIRAAGAARTASSLARSSRTCRQMLLLGPSFQSGEPRCSHTTTQMHCTACHVPCSVDEAMREEHVILSRYRSTQISSVFSITRIEMLFT